MINPTVLNQIFLAALDNVITKVTRGDMAYIKPGMKHAIKANTELHIIEVQVGDELTEEDIERLDWNWDQDGLQT